MRRLGSKLVTELLGNLHRDRTIIQSSNRRVEMVVDKVLVGNRSKVLGTPRDGCRIQQVPRLLVGSERDEELPNHPRATTLIPLGIAMRDVSKRASGLALNLVVILIGKLELRLVVRVLMLTLIGREPRVGAGLATTITRRTVQVEGAAKVARALTAVAVTHLAPNGLENLVVVQHRRNLDDDRTNLEAASGGVGMRHHLRSLRLDVEVRIMNMCPSRLLTPENRRRILKDARGSVVGVGDTDATATLGNPQAGLRDSGVGTVVSGERHVCFCFLKKVKRKSFEKGLKGRV